MQEVKLHGLKNRPELNDRVGRVIGIDTSTNRYRVMLPDSLQVLKVKKENMMFSVYFPLPKISEEDAAAINAATADLPDLAPLESIALLDDVLAADANNPLAQRIQAMLQKAGGESK